MDVYVLGIAVHPPADQVRDKRLEEMVFDTTRAALGSAGIRREEIDHVTIAASDELDGRAISSMLLAMPSGAYLRDEMKCTDSGLTGLCLGAMRVASGLHDLGLVVSWSKTSESPLEDVMRMRCEPFYTRPIGLNMTIADGLFAQAVTQKLGLDEQTINHRVVESYRQAAKNPRGTASAIPETTHVSQSPFVATPLRKAHQAPVTDGAAAIVLASEKFMATAPGRKPLARLAGIGWRNERYELSAERLTALTGFKGAISDALRTAGRLRLADVQVLELDAQTPFHHFAFEAALGSELRSALSPSGGAFAQNPYFCTGLVNAVEAVLQVSQHAAGVQVSDVRRAIAHGAHGFAQQGNVAVLFEGV